MPDTILTFTKIYCSLEQEGLHKWADCPHDDVEYLRDLHRHVFHIKCYSDVKHSNRDIEFIRLKHEIQSYLINTYWDRHLDTVNFGNMSCEMIAEELIEMFDLCECEVSEDGENGALVQVQRVST